MQSAMIFTAKYLYIFIAALAAAFVISRGRADTKRMIIFAVFSLPLTFVLAKAMGHLYFDPRPFVTSHTSPLIAHNPDNGFPSDHALLVFALACLVFVFDKKMGLLFGLLALAVGVARVYVGLHSPIDIAGSFLISAFAASGIYAGREIIRRRTAEV